MSDDHRFVALEIKPASWADLIPKPDSVVRTLCAPPAETTALLYALLPAAGDRACARPSDQEAITKAATEIVARALIADDGP